MINKYITATFLAVASIGNISSQNVRPVPKLVVNIAIDQLRTDYIEAFIPYYSEGGIKKLLRNGAVYSNAQYMFLQWTVHHQLHQFPLAHLHHPME